MGKINQPTTTIEQPEVVDTDQPITILNNQDEGDDTSQSPSSDEMSITNEAIRLISLKQELGIDATDNEYDGQIKGILEWAKDTGIKNKNQLLSKLREIKYKLGYQDEKNSVKSIYQYIKIDSQIKSLVNKQEILHAKRD